MVLGTWRSSAITRPIRRSGELTRVRCAENANLPNTRKASILLTPDFYHLMINFQCSTVRVARMMSSGESIANSPTPRGWGVDRYPGRRITLKKQNAGVEHIELGCTGWRTDGIYVESHRSSSRCFPDRAVSRIVPLDKPRPINSRFPASARRSGSSGPHNRRFQDVAYLMPHAPRSPEFSPGGSWRAVIRGPSD